ncbi:hypothetical protein [Rhizobiales bacterium]|uniref:hypothetical protein n=1 Tax=Rhizobium leguminosarum TaxID=384 RepID=UPI0013AFF1C1
MIEGTIADFGKSLATANDFLAQYPPAAIWTVGALRKIGDLARSVKIDVLRMRSAVLADAGAVATLKTMVR